MTLSDELKLIAKKELLSKLKVIETNKLDLVEDVRRILSLAEKAGISDDDLFLPIKGIESQTDHIPVGDVRKQFNESYLKELDKEQEELTIEFKDQLIDASKKILNKLENE